MKKKVVAALLVASMLTGCGAGNGVKVSEGPDGPTVVFMAEKSTDDNLTETKQEADDSLTETKQEADGFNTEETETSEETDSAVEAKSVTFGDSITNNGFVYPVPEGFVSFFGDEGATYLLSQDRSAEIWITGQSTEEVGDMELSDEESKYVVTYSLCMLMIANGFGESSIVSSSPFTTKNGVKGIRVDYENEDGKACSIGLWTGKSLSMPFVISKSKSDDAIATFVAMVNEVSLENE